MTRANIVLAAVVVCLALALGWVLAKGNPWKAKAVAAQQGQAVATETGRITEKTLTRETIIYKQSEANANDIEALPSGKDAVPRDVRCEWLSGLGRVSDDCPAGGDRGP